MDSDRINKIKVLEQIILNKGSCDWVLSNRSFGCDMCPLGEINEENGQSTCLRLINLPIKTIEHDRMYKAAALEKLSELLIENVIDKEERKCNGTEQ